MTGQNYRIGSRKLGNLCPNGPPRFIYSQTTGPFSGTRIREEDQAFHAVAGIGSIAE